MNILKCIRKLFRLHQKRRRVNGVYVGCVCEICGEILKGGTKTKHIQEKHPETIKKIGGK